MKVFWHFFISNIKYNKIEIGISYVISILVLIAFNYLRDPKHPDGEVLFSVAFYALLYAFYTNKKKYSLKYLVSLPLSKSQLLITKVTSDLLFFIPAIALGFWAALNSNIPVTPIPFLIILTEVVIFVSFIMFDSDIEEPRLNNARSSFLNRLIYVRKMIDFFFLSIFVVYLALAINFLPIEMHIKEYLLIVLMVVILFLKYNKSLKLMKDESLSYFVARRDLFRIGWKVAIFAVPLIAFKLSGYKLPSKYGDEKYFTYIEKNKIEELKEIIDEIPKGLKGKMGYTAIEAAIAEGNLEALDLLLEAEHEIDYKAKFERKTSTREYHDIAIIHLAVLSDNMEMLKRVIELNPEQVDLQTTDKLTPLTIAANNCMAEQTEYLIEHKAKVDHQIGNGNTALNIAIVGKCHTVVTILLEHGANPNIENQKHKSAFDLAGKNYEYFLSRYQPRVVKEKVKRDIASSEEEKSEPEEDVISSPKAFPKLQLPKLLHPQK